MTPPGSLRLEFIWTGNSSGGMSTAETYCTAEWRADWDIVPASLLNDSLHRQPSISSRVGGGWVELEDTAGPFPSLPKILRCSLRNRVHFNNWLSDKFPKALNASPAMNDSSDLLTAASSGSKWAAIITNLLSISNFYHDDMLETGFDKMFF